VPDVQYIPEQFMKPECDERLRHHDNVITFWGSDALSNSTVNVSTPREVFPPADCTFNACRSDRTMQIELAKQEWEFTADSIPQLIFLLDCDGHILRANRTLEHWGLGQVVDVRGLNVHDLLHPQCQDADCHLGKIWRTSTDNMAQDFAVEYQTEDKYLQRYLNLHFRFHRSPQKAEAGFIVAVISDISDIKQAEKNLQKSNEELEHRIEESTFALISTNIRLQQEIEKHKHIEEKLDNSHEEYSQLIEAMDEGLAILDKHGIITYVNKQFCETLGHAREKILGHTPADYVDEDNRSALERHMAERARGGITTYVANLKGADGQNFWVKISPTLLVGKQGESTGSFAIIADDIKELNSRIRSLAYDINYRKDAEQSLLESAHTKRMLAAQVMSAQEKERKRIASELHDGIGQTLSAIKFYVENAIRNLNEHTIANSAQMFTSVVPKLQDAIEEVRRISMDLRPSLLDDIGTLATLTWFCRQFQHIYESMRIELRIDIQENDIPAPLKIAIFRIVQEAMNNCAKYSQASCVQITLIKSDTEIELAVEDDGRGFDYAEVCAKIKELGTGMGLVSMRERAEFSGGMFSIESATGRGTSMRVVWPYQEATTPITTS
jgi:PAS domain S-box-containing protein